MGFSMVKASWRGGLQPPRNKGLPLWLNLDPICFELTKHGMDRRQWAS
jgi:hypothetical protein